MITLIVGAKGEGKTKKLLEIAQNAIEKSNGNVIVIEKGSKLTYDIPHQARLIDVDNYQVSGFDSFYGFLSGVCAANYDVTDIIVESTFKICGNDFNQLEIFIKKLDKISTESNVNIFLSVSADKNEIPENIKSISEQI